MSDGLRPVLGEDDTALGSQIPFSWIPLSLRTSVNQLMIRLGYPPIPAPGPLGASAAGE